MLHCVLGHSLAGIECLCVPEALGLCADHLAGAGVNGMHRSVAHVAVIGGMGFPGCRLEPAGLSPAPHRLLPCRQL